MSNKKDKDKIDKITKDKSTDMKKMKVHTKEFDKVGENTIKDPKFRKRKLPDIVADGLPDVVLDGQG